ncbi:hypothetical protein [Streptosporangium sandarakinum]|uniref:hypothetical protein n=1 Tax=Streptosporangium sandarakinum TaxID=1260955 RepID=UPI00341375BC
MKREAKTMLALVICGLILGPVAAEAAQGPAGGECVPVSCDQGQEPGNGPGPGHGGGNGHGGPSGHWSGGDMWG